MSEMMQGGMPPELASLLGGGGAPPPGDPGMMPPEQGAPEGGESTIDILNQMLDLAKLYMEVDEDEEDKMTMAKVLSILQGYLAAEQRESQDAMQGKLSPKLLAQSYGG
jgi:hypothetical protein